MPPDREPGAMLTYRTLVLLCVLILSGLASSQGGLWVRVATPTTGSAVSGPFTVSGTATPFQRIMVRGTLPAQTQSDGRGQWSVQLDPASVPAGQPINLNIVAKDGAGNTSAPVRLKLASPGAASNSSSNLQLSVNLPANGATVTNPFTLSGTATPGMLVEVSGGLSGQTYAAADGTWSLSLGGGSPGQVVDLSVVAREGSGQRSREVKVRYALAGAAPDAPPAPPQPRLIVKVLAPVENDTVGDTVLVSGVASPGTRIDIQAVPTDPAAATILFFETTVAGPDQRYQARLELHQVPPGTPVDLFVRPQDGTGKVIKVRVFRGQ